MSGQEETNEGEQQNGCRVREMVKPTTLKLSGAERKAV